MGLTDDPDALLFGLVSRLTGQKGIDLVMDALPALLAGGGQLAVLGSGGTRRWRRVSGRRPRRIPGKLPP